MTKLTNKRARLRGMTLIEVMVALMIITIIILGLLQLFVQSIYVQDKSETEVIAANYGREKVEELKSLGYDSITLGITNEDRDDGLYTVKTTVTNEMDPGTGYPRRIKRIAVEVFCNLPAIRLIGTQITYIHKRGV